MKSCVLFLLFTISLSAMAQNAETVYEKRGQTTSVTAHIHASPEAVWALLTNAEEFPNWNSTVLNIDGEIALGEKIKLTSILQPEKAFKLKVTEMVVNESMVWSDGKGRRVYTIEKTGHGCNFTMSETIGGFMYPMYKKYLPDFASNFEQFARDLKNAAEN